MHIPNPSKRSGKTQFVRLRFLNVDASLIVFESFVVIA